MKLFVPFSQPIDYERWIILDSIPRGEERGIWNYLGLENDHYVIDKRLVPHYSYQEGSRCIGVIICDRKRSATILLIRLKLKLSEFNASCFKASDVLQYIKNKENILDKNDDEKIVQLTLSFSSLYKSRLLEVHGQQNRIQASILHGIKEIDEQSSNFTHHYLFEMFGEVIPLSNSDFRFASHADAIAAVWGLSGQHIAFYQFHVKHKVAMNAVLTSNDLPFVSTFKKASHFPRIALDLSDEMSGYFPISRHIEQLCLNAHELPACPPLMEDVETCHQKGLSCNYYSVYSFWLRCDACSSLKWNPNYELLSNEEWFDPVCKSGVFKSKVVVIPLLSETEAEKALKGEILPRPEISSQFSF